jgi:hypothetical protein
MENKNDTSEKISNSRPVLSEADKAHLWSKIESQVKTQATPSPYWSYLKLKNPMAPIALMLMLMLGTGGVVAAAENARPGDSLFIIEQKVEDLRLALASGDNKTRLEAEFAAKRLAELSSILNESVSTSSTTTVEVKAGNEDRIDKALGVTLSYLLSNSLSPEDKESLLRELTSLLSNSPLSIDNRSVVPRGGSERVEIKSRSDDDFEIRDGQTRIRIKDGEVRVKNDDDWDDSSDWDDDRNDDSSSSSNSGSFEAEADVYFDRTVVEVEINDRKSIFETSAKTKEAVAKEISTRFNLDLNLVLSRLDFEIEDSSTNNDRRSDDDSSRDDSDYDSDNSSSSDGRLEVEIEIEDGVAEVKVEYGGRKTEFTTNTTSIGSIVSEISTRTGLSKTQIESVMEVEID